MRSQTRSLDVHDEEATDEEHGTQEVAIHEDGEDLHGVDAKGMVKYTKTSRMLRS